MTAGRADPGEGTGLRVPWSRSERPVPRRVVRPLQAFLETEASSGVLLLAAAVIALAWANSPWRSAYEDLWHTELSLSLGPWSLAEDLRGWINDALMVLFFFVVGLEIKRELAYGELSELRAAALPAIAAVGGMVVPALLYLALNPGGHEARGWGIPMATDIAFAVGVLSLVGSGLPASLKSFLLALAIVDDIGAIVVIALFYSGRIEWAALGAAAALLLAMAGLRRAQVQWMAVYVALGFGVWLATLQSGVHATIAGVALGLLAPAEPFQRPRAVSAEAHRVADETVDEPAVPDQDAAQWLRLAQLSREAVSHVTRLEHLLHGWTSFLVVPVFALANAGVALDPSSVREAAASSVALGILVGLVAGKPVGITLASWVSVRMGLARLPAGVRWPHLMGVAALAGIGFTVSLFIAALAFTAPESAEAARAGILGASVLATLLGAGVLRVARGGGAGEPLEQDGGTASGSPQPGGRTAGHSPQPGGRPAGESPAVGLG